MEYEQRTPIPARPDDGPIPDHVIEALIEVRDTGIVNMMMRREVAQVARAMGADPAAWWLEQAEGKRRYVDALRAMGEDPRADRQVVTDGD